MDTKHLRKSRSGVIENPNGGYHIHIQLDEREPDTTRNQLLDPCPAMPPSTPVLVEMSVFEDCVLLVFFYHADGTLWRAVPLEQLNPGWVLNTYRFRGDLRKFDVRLARMCSSLARPSWQTRPTFWATAGWRDAVVHVPLGLAWRIHDWQHSNLPELSIATPNDEQVERLSQAYPADVQRVLAVREETEKKDTYQIGGINLLLNYVEGVGLAESVNRYCTRDGGISDGTVITVLIINRLLSPCALKNLAKWVNDTGLHLLLGIADPGKLNYDRLVDALLAVYPHWQTIATEVTLRTVEEFQLRIDTVHYDLTSVFFHGEYEGSDWVTFGYSRDKRPDKRQVNIGISATADGEVVLPGGSGIHSGETNDGTTTVQTHERLHKLFQRSDLLVTGDSIMHSAKNTLLISRAHGRFLGPTKMTPCTRRVVAACAEDEFVILPASTDEAGREIKATFRRLWFTAKMKMTPAERDREAIRRKRLGIGGRRPVYREVQYWMRAAVILDTERQKADAKRRHRLIEAYESKLKWTLDRLHKRRYYDDPEWVSGHLADLAHQFKDVRAFVKVDFTVRDGRMSLTHERRPERIAEAAKLDGRWVLVTNQRREAGQHRTGPYGTVSLTDYLDWMCGVYKNHRHVERRMRNLKSDLPIRPIYLQRDDAIVALMVYTLIERDCQADPVMVEAGLRTTDEVLNVLGGYCVSTHLTPSGYEVFWPDTSTEKQKLIWRQLQIPDPGTRVPDVCPASQEANLTQNSVSFLCSETVDGYMRQPRGPSDRGFDYSNPPLLDGPAPRNWIVKVLIATYLFCYAENELQQGTLLRIHRFAPDDVQFGDALVSSAIVWFRKETPIANHKVEFSYGGALAKPEISSHIPVHVLRQTAKWTQFPKTSSNWLSGADPNPDHIRLKLADVFTIKRGLVTGANKFFILTPEQISQHQLPHEFLQPILPSPRYLMTSEIWADRDGTPIVTPQLFLLSCNLPENVIKARFPSLWKYLQLGVQKDIDKRYLCRNRSPWYSQESRLPSPFLCTYVGRQSPGNKKPFRFILNHSKATAPNVYLMLYPRLALKRELEDNAELLAAIWQILNEIPSDTLIGEGRVYGGGLHKIEPNELANTPVNGLLTILPDLSDTVQTQPPLFDYNV